MAESELDMTDYMDHIGASRSPFLCSFAFVDSFSSCIHTKERASTWALNEHGIVPYSRTFPFHCLIVVAAIPPERGMAV